MERLVPGAPPDAALSIPEVALVLLIGPAGSGKTTFARRHFRPTEVLSSDAFRAMVCDDEADQSATRDAFEVLHLAAAKRLKRGRLTVIDATNLRDHARRPLLALARHYHVQRIAIVFDLPEALCRERNRARLDRRVPSAALASHAEQLRRALAEIPHEGFQRIYLFTEPEQVDAATILRERLPVDRRDEHGPFDIVGDVHGCFDELVELLGTLGYRIAADDRPGRFGYRVEPPPGRKAVFLGDLVDRGPRVPDVLRLVMSMVADGVALCVVGNHDDKLMRKLKGRNVRISHGLAESLEQLEREPPEFREAVCRFIAALPSHYVLDEGRLVVAHAGLKEELQGRVGPAVRDFALYGQTTGECDEFGLPIRYPWARDYRGRARVVYGHTPVWEPEWVNNTINIDTGCVFGGRLTALRYPEYELVSVPARREYARPARPIRPEELPAVPAPIPEPGPAPAPAS